ncbi:hypothetical protein [Sporosarcina sp. HYO08]|uniref:hypothetical protein n=1 Tax=Sporosarcina sp. HYO08 TaxID=1759557 RepID=UPI000799F0C7|nr:hypothetical protein [Sporosarcina sp. HYO08]KXH83756.1 hypothetical protein AU377_03030 [Sporosarcina sp. HYO08]
MKKISVFFMTFVMFITLNISAKADEHENELSQEEKDYLLEVSGFTEEEVLNFPVEVARELVNGKAKKIDSVLVEEPKVVDSNMISPMADIPVANLSMHATVSSVQSDWSGYKKFFISGGFDWKSQPVWALTDKLTIGFPSSLGVTFNTSGGNVTGHSSRYYLLNTATNVRTYSALKTIPSYWSPGAGVAAAYDLLLPGSTQKNMRHGGLIGQFFYIKSTSSGRANVKLEYGHKKVSGSVGVSVYPAGVGITPSTNLDTRSYALTFNY